MGPRLAYVVIVSRNRAWCIRFLRNIGEGTVKLMDISIAFITVFISVKHNGSVNDFERIFLHYMA